MFNVRCVQVSSYIFLVCFRSLPPPYAHFSLPPPLPPCNITICRILFLSYTFFGRKLILVLNGQTYKCRRIFFFHEKTFIFRSTRITSSIEIIQSNAIKLHNVIIVIWICLTDAQKDTVFEKLWHLIFFFFSPKNIQFLQEVSTILLFKDSNYLKRAAYYYYQQKHELISPTYYNKSLFKHKILIFRKK